LDGNVVDSSPVARPFNREVRQIDSN